MAEEKQDRSQESEEGNTGTGPELNKAPIVDFWADTNLFGMFLAQCASIPNLIVESYILEIHKGTGKVEGEKKVVFHMVKDLESGWFARFKAACGVQVPGEAVRLVPILVTLTVPVAGVNFAGRVLQCPLVQFNSALVNLMQKTPAAMRQQFVRIKIENNVMNIRFCNQSGGFIVLNNPCDSKNGG